MSASRRPRVGLVLGSGSARGWAHVGVIRALEHAKETSEEGKRAVARVARNLSAFRNQA